MPDIFIKENSKETEKAGSSETKLIPEKEDKKEYHSRKNVHDLLGHSHNPLSSFCYYPDKVSFINEDPEEKVILLLRRHPITNLRWIVIAVIMLLIPSFVFLLIPQDAAPLDFQVILSLIWYLLTTAFIFEGFLSWYFHVNIVTDERIVEVDFHNLIHREVTDANIDRIEDVTVEIGGGLRTLFNYGNVFIQTSAEVPRIEFEAVPHPDRVSRILRELRIEEEREKLEGRVR